MPPRVNTRPTFYAITANDIYTSILNSDCICYAGDTNLLCSGSNVEFITLAMELDMIRMINWFQCIRLSLNPSKTKSMLFNPRGGVIGNLCIKTGNQQIEQVETFKCLGIYLDEGLKWETHVNHVISKICANKYMLNTTKNLLTKENLLKLYYAHVYPHLTYGLHIWGNMISSKLCNKIFKVQKTVVRILAHASYNAHTILDIKYF